MKLYAPDNIHGLHRCGIRENTLCEFELCSYSPYSSFLLGQQRLDVQWVLSRLFLSIHTSEINHRLPPSGTSNALLQSSVLERGAKMRTNVLGIAAIEFDAALRPSKVLIPCISLARRFEYDTIDMLALIDQNYVVNA